MCRVNESRVEKLAAIWNQHQGLLGDSQQIKSGDLRHLDTEIKTTNDENSMLRTALMQLTSQDGNKLFHSTDKCKSLSTRSIRRRY